MDLSKEGRERLAEAIELLQGGHESKAETLLRELQVDFPESKEVGRVLGQALVRMGDLNAACQHYASLVESSGRDPVCVLDYATVLRRLGERELATAELARTLETCPTLAPGWYLQGDLLVELDRSSEAISAYDNAQKHDPFRVQIDQVKRSLSEGEEAKARRILEHILELDDKHVEALAGLAVLYMQSAEYREARRLFNLALNRTSYWPTLLMGLAQLFLQRSMAIDAEEILDTLLRVNPDSVLAWNMLGTARELQMKHEAAIAAYKKSLALEPEQPRALVSIGNIFRVIGHRQECEEYLKRATACPGVRGEAFWSLGNLKDYVFSNDEMNEIHWDLLKDSVSLHNAAPLCFAMAAGLEQRNNFADAFKLYERGNAIQKQYSGFDVPLYLREVEEIKSVFNGHFFENNVATKSRSVVPIFIVGMPRAGSTLVEQLLSAHSDIEATMELPFIGQFVREIDETLGHLGRYPESARAMAPDLLDEFAQRYLDLSASYRSGRGPFFIDKMPNNFVHIGLIKSLLPEAKIIDVRRHPMDTLVSVFKQRFAVGQSYSYDLEDIAAYFKGYRSLMDHWGSVLPGAVCTVNYESLVTNLQSEVERLLQYLGLEPQVGCYSTEQNPRAIRTPSSEQVRSPVTRKRIGFWQNYASQLAPVQKQLAEEIAAYEQALLGSS